MYVLRLALACMLRVHVMRAQCIYVETLANPSYNVPDFDIIAKIAHDELKVPLVVDNTFGMGGYTCRPLKWGAGN